MKTMADLSEEKCDHEFEWTTGRCSKCHLLYAEYTLQDLGQQELF